ncbi:unnamed protein product, partial [Mesorhabditis belari]|uniref:RBD domain-containing protein n=1 Tax=Mesorhabditis belari TaxID=2138241 RepID=A0AAF3J3G8_9BILA
MTSLTVVCPNARRCPIKVTPGKLLREVLEEACLKQGYNPEQFELIHQKKRIDLSLPFRLTGLPNNAAVDLREKDNIQETIVEIALQGLDGNRKIGKFSLDATLADMLLYFSKEFEDDLLKFDETLHPSCAFMNKQYQGRKELECTTLRSMGLGSGKVLIRFNRIPMSAMEVAQTEERIEQERRKKEALAAEFQKKRAENEEREKIERERMQKFEEEQRSQPTPSVSRDVISNSNPNSWSFDRHPFQAAISSGPANDRLTYLNSLLNNVDASLAGQTSNGQVNNLVEQLASEGRLHGQQNMSEQYPLMNFKFPEKTTAIEDADMDDQSTSMTAQTGQDIEAPDRQSVLFTKSDQVKQEQQRALLPKAYIETKNRELKLTSWKNTVIRAVLPDRRVLQLLDPEKTLIDVGVAPSSTIYVKFSPPMAACEDIFKVDSVKEVTEEEANQSSKEWLSTNEAYKPWVGTVGPEAPRPMVRRPDENQDAGPSVKREPPMLPKWLKR